MKGTIDLVSAAHAVDAEVRLYERLFTVEHPLDVEEGGSFRDHLNPESLEVVRGKLEPSLGEAKRGERFQFERLGYFVVDPNSRAEGLVFNRTIMLRDTWAKVK